MSERLVPLGEIVTTHGLHGWLKLNPLNPGSAALDSVTEVYLERGGARSVHRLETKRPHSRQILIKLFDIDTMEAAKALVGATLCIDEDSLPRLKPGEYYHFQVIGLEVYDTCGSRLGTITQTWQGGGSEIYVVAGESKEYLIPAVKDIIEKIDFDAGKIVIDPPTGLLDL